MLKNIGKLDRMLRIILGMVLGLIGYFTDQLWLYIVALIPIITAVTGWCPTYAVLKISTKERHRK